MELRFYNTLTRRIELFEPLEPGRVRMYHCGPTVYQRPHIGNYRAFLFADLLRRVLEARQFGFKVQQVMNITDVGHLVDDADEGEDKLQAQAEKERIDPWELVERVSGQFFADLAALAVKTAHHYPRATQHIPQMVKMVLSLLATGHAYRVGDNVYFDVHSFPAYGRLSGNRIEDLEAGARLEINPEKRHPADFALWKSDSRHVMKWDTELGPHGFPGWHIECSAMSMEYLGACFDIHTGGEDNVFPHHECEIAQSECVTGQPFVKLWMHTRFLQVDGGKMSKSLGNVWSLDDLAARGFAPLDFRFLILKAHYRGIVNFSWEALKGAAEARRSLADLYGRLNAAGGEPKIGYDPAPGPSSTVGRLGQAFWSALADDLNASEALAQLFQLRSRFLAGELSQPNEIGYAIALLSEANGIFEFLEGVLPARSLSDGEVAGLIAERAAARAARDFARADAIRDRLQQDGIVLEDRAGGVHWHRA